MASANGPQETSQAAPPTAPLCDFCPAGFSRPRAEAGCLTCRASFCAAHLLPHQRHGAFQGHCLLGPEGQWEARGLAELRRDGRRCGEHRQREVELFCRDCRLCVCALCPALGPHRGHSVTLIQQEAEEKKKLTAACLQQLDMKKKQEFHNIKHIEQAASDLKDHALASKTWLTGKFAELRLLLDEEEKVAKKMIDEKTQCALWAYDGQTESCRARINKIDSFSEKVIQIQQWCDTIELVKDYTAVEKEIMAQRTPAEEWHPVPVTFEHMQNYFACFAGAIKATLEKPLQERLQKAVLSSMNANSNQMPGALLKVKPTVDRTLFLKHARSPSLDPVTVHPRLRLSEDRFTVFNAWMSTLFSSHPLRFDKLWQVMSRDAYFSGSHYWEVDLVNAGQGWWIGATYPSIQRKGDSEASRLGWNRASWCIKRFDYEYWAFHKGDRTPIQTEEDPEKIGVFLDYEAGILSFYNATCGMTHLHTFHSRFTEPLYPALRVWEGSITICKLT
ncbi:tripartite motif-containing protein 14 [Ambystoma mexicanum]|uniref:tripartite motif-containing protein 14 n=1 Tax=Ambystoma mexicanum TaxID=8296 RepID=UPI0037E9A1B1